MLKETNNDTSNSHRALEEVEWCIDYVCNRISPTNKDDVKQDIRVRLLCEMSEMEGSTIQEKIDYCLSKIRYYRQHFFKRYNNTKEIPYEDIEELMVEHPAYYRLDLDLGTLETKLSRKEVRLLRFLMLNGIEVAYKEIQNHMGYSSPSSAMRAIRRVLQRVRNILNEEGEFVYSEDEEYRRYRK